MWMNVLIWQFIQIATSRRNNKGQSRLLPHYLVKPSGVVCCSCLKITAVTGAPLISNGAVAMGSPLDPPMTNSFLTYHEVKWLSESQSISNHLFKIAMLMTRFLYFSLQTIKQGVPRGAADIFRGARILYVILSRKSTMHVMCEVWAELLWGHLREGWVV